MNDLQDRPAADNEPAPPPDTIAWRSFALTVQQWDTLDHMAMLWDLGTPGEEQAGSGAVQALLVALADGDVRLA